MTKSTRISIKCRKANGYLEFYSCFGGEEIFLFSQRYNKAVFTRFCRGVELSEALTPERHCGRRSPLGKVSDKLPAYIRYAEQEYGVVLLRSHRAPDNRRTLKMKAEKNDIRYAA